MISPVVVCRPQCNLTRSVAFIYCPCRMSIQRSANVYLSPAAQLIPDTTEVLFALHIYDPHTQRGRADKSTLSSERQAVCHSFFKIKQTKKKWNIRIRDESNVTFDFEVTLPYFDFCSVDDENLPPWPLPGLPSGFQ